VERAARSRRKCRHKILRTHRRNRHRKFLRSRLSLLRSTVAAKKKPKQRQVLTSDWCAWISENVVDGVSAKEIVDALIDNDVPAALAKRAVKEISQSPALHGVAAALARARAAELRARLYRELTKGVESSIERRPLPKSADEIFDRYWSRNRPVVFTNAIKRWKLWTPKDMKRELGDLEITVTDDRESDPLYDQNSATHSKTTTIGKFVDRILRAPKKKTNDFYMVANNKTMDRPEMRAFIHKHIVIDEKIFDPKLFVGGTSLWLGPKGTVTPLHHDGTNIFFNQVYGRKQFLLISPNEERLLEHAHGHYVLLDPEQRKQDDFWKDIAVHKVVLEPGETLFLPVAWWHHVRSLDVSISFSLLNFRRPNNFDWYRPGFLSQPKNF
jgi:hypothetical protein